MCVCVWNLSKQLFCSFDKLCIYHSRLVSKKNKITPKTNNKKKKKKKITTTNEYCWFSWWWWCQLVISVCVCVSTLTIFKFLTTFADDEFFFFFFNFIWKLMKRKSYMHVYMCVVFYVWLMIFEFSSIRYNRLSSSLLLLLLWPCLWLLLLLCTCFERGDDIQRKKNLYSFLGKKKRKPLKWIQPPPPLQIIDLVVVVTSKPS